MAVVFPASASLLPVSAARPLVGSSVIFGASFQKKKNRIPAMRVRCAADDEEKVNDLGVNVALSMLKFYKNPAWCKQEKYHLYFLQAAATCQLAVSTLCKRTKDMVF